MTMTSVDRRAILTAPNLATDLIASLKTACTNASAPLLMYCLMPDHLHALIQITEIDLITILRNYKSYTTKLWWKHGGSGALWQRSAYDRGVRSFEHADDVIRYVFDNPLELGEIERWIERGWLGGALLADH